jgi:hypothetical protein
MIRSLRVAVPGLVFALALAAPIAAVADDSGQFIIRLGQDTTSVERYTRTANHLEVDQVGRAPRVLQRHFTYDYDKSGALTRFTMAVTPPSASAPTQSIEATFDKDSARVKTQSGATPATTASYGVPAGTLVMALSAPWALYEDAMMKLAKAKGDSLRTTMYAVGAPNTYWLSLHRLGRDSVAIINERGDQYHVKVDKTGRILGVSPIAGTAKVSAERVASVDLAALTASFAAREQSGAGMGVLSPRDSVKTTVAGASLYVDYGRPGKRGRVVFGTVVPYGDVWRTGANAATQFRTDKALDFGGTVVPAGFYTLWTVPQKDTWTLVINSETGQWGTEHKADKDLYKIPMKLSTLPQSVEKFTISIEPAPEGGVIHMDWDTTRATANFAVKP